MADSYERAAQVCDDAGRMWLAMPTDRGAFAGCTGAIALAMQLVARQIRILAMPRMNMRIEVTPTLRVAYGVIIDGSIGWAMIDDRADECLPYTTAQEALDMALERAREACS